VEGWFVLFLYSAAKYICSEGVGDMSLAKLERMPIVDAPAIDLKSPVTPFNLFLYDYSGRFLKAFRILNIRPFTPASVYDFMREQTADSRRRAREIMLPFRRRAFAKFFIVILPGWALCVTVLHSYVFIGLLVFLAAAVASVWWFSHEYEKGERLVQAAALDRWETCCVKEITDERIHHTVKSLSRLVPWAIFWVYRLTRGASSSKNSPVVLVVSNFDTSIRYYLEVIEP
jgi:hypothetical protein